MSRETWEERQARESRRDALREVAWGTAKHIAGANMQRVERVVSREGYPGFKFSGPVRSVRCRCGLPATPVPHRPDAFGGFSPWWLCPLCDIVELLKQYARLERRLAE